MMFGTTLQLVYIVGNLAYISALIALGWELGHTVHHRGTGMLPKLVNTVVGLAVILLIILSGFLGLAFPLMLLGMTGTVMLVAFMIFPLGALAFVALGHWLGERATAPVGRHANSPTRP
jgi:hypothetical protein